MREIHVPTSGLDGRPEHYVFSNEWFETLTLQLWQQHILPRAASIKCYLEIGVCDGRSLCWMIDNVLSQHGKDWRAFGIDPYIAKDETREDWVGDNVEQKWRAHHNLDWAQARNNLWLVEERSQDWLRRQQYQVTPDWLIEPGTLDMVFIDGSHSAREAMEDMVLSFPLLRRGGIMVIDDVDRRWRRGAPSVYEAARGFTDAYEGIIDWLYRSPRQWAITRRK
jgi:hypothetical protein